MPVTERRPAPLFTLETAVFIALPQYEFSLPKEIPPGSKVYLIHFDKPLKHARHYLGYSKDDVRGRVQKHRTGNGARLMEAARKNGISWHVSRIWEGDYELEHILKRQHNARHLCPTCIQEKIFERTFSVVRNARTGERHPLRRAVKRQPSLWED